MSADNLPRLNNLRIKRIGQILAANPHFSLGQAQSLGNLKTSESTLIRSQLFLKLV